MATPSSTVPTTWPTTKRPVAIPTMGCAASRRLTTDACEAPDSAPAQIVWSTISSTGSIRYAGTSSVRATAVSLGARCPHQATDRDRAGHDRERGAQPQPQHQGHRPGIGVALAHHVAGAVDRLVRQDEAEHGDQRGSDRREHGQGDPAGAPGGLGGGGGGRGHAVTACREPARASTIPSTVSATVPAETATTPAGTSADEERRQRQQGREQAGHDHADERRPLPAPRAPQEDEGRGAERARDEGDRHRRVVAVGDERAGTGRRPTAVRAGPGRTWADAFMGISRGERN